MTNRLRIFLADELPIMLRGLEAELGAAEDLNIVGQATDCDTALARIVETRPDVVVADLSSAGLGGGRLARSVARVAPEVRFVAYSGQEGTGHVRFLLATGVRGCVLKRSPASHLLEAIRTVAGGGVYVDPGLEAAVTAPTPLRILDDGAAGPEIRLSAREAEVLRLIAQGFCNREIAERLGLSTKTIETYKARSLEKLGLSRRAEIVRFALERGWLGRPALGVASPET